MPDENNPEINKGANETASERGKGGGDLLIQFLKVLGIIVAVLVLMVVIGFGLLVGLCRRGTDGQYH